MPQCSGRYEVDALQSPVEILIDRWGVPHIYASTTHDAFVAQGWNAARDRLWQIDLWRRCGLGELAAVYGPAYVAQDRAIRRFTYRNDMASEWAAYGPESKANTEAFVTGINSYIEAAKADARLLPTEFKLAGYEPAMWHAEDVPRVRVHSAAGSGAMQQLIIAQLVSGRPDILETGLPVKIAPPWTPVNPAGLDVRELPADVLEEYRLARKPFALGEGAIGKQGAARATVPRFGFANGAGQGSNNWVIAPTKSATGRAILANDPHRFLEVPSLRYLVHLTAPGLNVIGAGQPALPGIEIGHNDNVAFGFTVFPIAQEDLLIYETRAGCPNEYLYLGEWEPMTVLRETIPVRGGDGVPVELKFSRHGPIVYEDPDRHRAYAVRAAWLDSGAAPYMGALRYLCAKNLEEYASEVKCWGGPGENHVCADLAGNIGWFAAGFTPVRLNSDGLLPLPGDGRYEWQGYLDGGLLPSEVNPVCGYIATANQMNLPMGYPYADRRVSFTWLDDARFRRIRGVLDGLKKVSINDCQTLQNDCVSLPAQALMRVLEGLCVTDPALRETVRWLSAWDGRITAESPQAALFEVWYSRYLVAGVLALIAPVMPEEAQMFVQPTVIADLIARPDVRLGNDPEDARDQLLLNTLREALLDTERRLGADRLLWQWGRLASTYFEHPLAQLADESLRSKMNVGPVPASGDASTVNLASYQSQNFRTSVGPSVRLVMDVGNWDGSVAMNVPGQSGDPLSPHYRDLLAPWRKGKYFPLAYSRGAVERATSQRIILERKGTC